MLIEVLWNVEIETVNGRREGERVVQASWWKTEILNVMIKDEKNIVTVKYDETFGYKEQESVVLLLPNYLRPEVSGS